MPKKGNKKSGGGPSVMKMYGKGKNPIMMKSPMKEEASTKGKQNLLKHYELSLIHI